MARLARTSAAGVAATVVALIVTSVPRPLLAAPSSLIGRAKGEAAECEAERPCAPVAVVVATFDGEYRLWRERLPLDKDLAFAAGALGLPLGWNPELRVLGIVTGMGPRNSALSITALGHDPRFDLSAAVWLVSGIAGFDPLRASVGSAAWARFLVDGDATRFVDPREAPPGWPTGFTPVQRRVPYAPPAPTAEERRGVVYALSAELVDWAYALSAQVQLPDSANLSALRAPYAASFPEGAGRAPRVLHGDGLATNMWWCGALSAEWARNWTRYWTAGEAVFVHSSMEDTGVAAALDALAAAGRARGSGEALLVLRSASNFVQPPPGHEPGVYDMPFDQDAGFMAGFTAGEPVVRALAAGRGPQLPSLLQHPRRAQMLSDHGSAPGAASATAERRIDKGVHVMFE